jgi:hypothetical protein
VTRRFPPPWSVEELDACSCAEFKNVRIASLIMLSVLFVQVAHAADEIRLSTFPNVLLGTWAETAEQCATKDKSNVVIEPAKYGDADGSCAVSWIDQTEGSRGINYTVRALCTSASVPEKTQSVNIVVRPLGPDRAAMGRIYLRSAESVFDNLKTYLRCP